MSLPTRIAARLAAPILLLLPACGGGDSTGGTRTPTALEVIGGNGQTGAVGAALTSLIRVKASDGRGPIPDVAIHAQVANGSVSPANGSTNADGILELSWTLGTALGPQTLSLSVAGGPSTAASATATAGPPVLVLATSLQFQVVVVGRAVPVRPTVRVTDAFGNSKAGVPVTFAVLAPSTSIMTGGAQTSDANGEATVGSWMLGADAGTHILRATIDGGAFADFQVTGAPASLTLFAGDGQTANAGTQVPVLPAVKAVRDDGSPLPGVGVTFTVSGGGGSVQGPNAITGPDGVARPAAWILGAAPGANTVIATALGAPPVLLTVTGIQAVPATMAPVSATSLSGLTGNFLSDTPSIAVQDATGHAVAGASVTFQVTGGNGSIFGATQTTDFLGRAAVGAWRLGNVGANAIQASVGNGVPPVSFTATANPLPEGTFKIEVRYVNGTPTDAQKAAFDQAAARWTQVILAGAPPYLVVPTDTDPTGDCPVMTGQTVDGIVIYARLVAIDGPGKILGSTGVCVLRDEGFLPVESLMEFDTADLATLQANNQLNQVILHEMAHALGYGTLWVVDAGALGHWSFVDGVPGADPVFTGAAARAGFIGGILFGSTFTGTPIPIENTGQQGTIYVHWRESTFGSEILTGFLDGGSTPLSAMSIQQFRDLGYTVNDGAADPYTFQAHLLGGFGPAPMPIGEGSIQGDIIVINRNGGVVKRIPRR